MFLVGSSLGVHLAFFARSGLIEAPITFDTTPISSKLIFFRPAAKSRFERLLSISTNLLTDAAESSPTFHISSLFLRPQSLQRLASLVSPRPQGGPSPC
ncbi:hypothetical protein AYI69_g1367 [Smittium culicis]|uniref:Uncharacterized protein n=1 Tax=Smittium culicis TaxID=133412 RepID=A0A1R1YQT5_9FUNG|nr:hypothetical protein AYI69_g1367 [Smittium culicis]